MELVKLQFKAYDDSEHYFIHDEIISGLLSGNYYVIEGSGKLQLIQDVIQIFKFPAKNGNGTSRISSFLARHSPDLAKQIEYYEA